MKKILILLFLIQLLTLNAQEGVNTKLDSIEHRFKSATGIRIENNIEIDSIFSTKIDALHSDLKKIEELVKSRSNFKDYLPLLVALLAGLLALFQVKANIISSARIEWTQNLRKVVSQYLAEITILNYNLRQVFELHNEGKEEEAKKLYDNQVESFKKVNEFGNQIKLFLNNKKETDHSELQKCIEIYYNKATHRKDSNEIDELEKMENEIITKSQEILKQAWEDAKTFNIKEIFKFSYK